jgi:thiol-disulfide isomerase/thioredoxin
MAQATGSTTKQRKRERQRVAAEARAAARKRQARRRTLGYALGAAALVAAVVVGVQAVSGDDGGTTSSQATQVSVVGAPRVEPLSAGETVPDFTAPAIGGGSVRWSARGEGPTVLSVWAPWCPHCQVELPLLDDVMSSYPGVNFLTVVTAIGAKPGPDPATFLRDQGIDASTAIDDSAGSIAAALGIRGFPTLYFVASDGTVVREMEGEVDESTLREVIGSLT